MNTNPVPLEHGRIYHIYNRGVNREPIFHGADNYRYFLDLYIRHVGWLVDTYAYCLLGNHFHFLLRVKEVEVLAAGGLAAEDLTGFGKPVRSDTGAGSPSRYFSNFFNAYARAFNKRYERTGALFRRPFGRIPVDSDGYLGYLVVYIHQNPLKHGFVDDYHDWPYSSYHALAGDRTSRIDRATVLDWMGGRAGFEMAHRQNFTAREDVSGL